MGYGGEGGIGSGGFRSPLIQANAGVDFVPVFSEVGDRRAWCADGFADGEVEVVGLDGQLPGGVPVLKEPGVDVQQCGRFEAAQGLVGR